jgi:lipoate-protein ligase A
VTAPRIDWDTHRTAALLEDVTDLVAAGLDVVRVAARLNTNPAALDKALRRAGRTDLTTALGRRPAWDEVADALAAGFAEALGVSLVAGELSEEERVLVEELRRGKYATEEWNLRR